MSDHISRRRILQTTAGVASLAFLDQLPPVSAAEATPDPEIVQFDASIESLVRLLEETPRDTLLEKVAGKIRSGTSYREILAALQLAGVRNVQPRPSVGHKFHSVLVVNSAHLASISAPPEHRWLPIFWALDYFKSAQARDIREGNWTMPAVAANLPAANKAPAAFVAAMDNWDEGAADSAVAQLARSSGANGVYEQFFRYAARDFRSIGHKAIFVANSFRTLQCIGWQHAEPIVRSLAYAMLNYSGDNPAQADHAADRPFRRNQELVKSLPADWQGGRLDEGATKELLAALATDDNNAACDLVVKQLNDGIAPQSIWDALHVGAAELLMRQPGIVALHAVTTTNAIYFAYQAAADEETRKLLLLQNAAFLPMFRSSMGGRGRIRDTRYESLGERTDIRKENGELDPAPLFAELSRDPTAAAKATFAYLQAGGSAKRLIDTGRLLIFTKGTGAHDYKFSSAMLEDYYHVSPNWRNYYMAANMFKLRGAGDRDNQLVARTEAALES